METPIEAECSRNCANLLNNYNNLLTQKNSNLKKQNEHLQITLKLYEKHLKEKRNCFINDVQNQDEREKNNLNNIETLKSMLYEKEDEVIKLVQQLHVVVGEMDKKQDHLQSCIEKARQHQETQDSSTGDVTCSLKSKSKSEQTSVNTKCSCANGAESERFSKNTCSCQSEKSPKQDRVSTQCSYENESSPPPEITTENNSEHNGCSDKQLLCDIETCVSGSEELGEPIKTLLNRSKIAIRRLMNSVDTQTTVLKKYEDDLRCISCKLNEERVVSISKNSEINTMKDDLNYLSNYLCEFQKNNCNLESNLNRVMEELYSRTEANNELSKKSVELTDELVNMKYCLSMRIEENKTLTRELREKNQTIENNIKNMQILECTLISVEQKAKEWESLKNICNSKCDELTAQNAKLKNDLNIEKTDNCEKVHHIDNLCHQVAQLETVIKGFDCQKSIFEEEIIKLKEKECVAKQKFNEDIDELHCVITAMNNELAITKSELSCAKEFIDNTNKENDSMKNKTNSLEYDVETLEKQLQECKCQNDTLTKKCMISELEVSELREKVKELKARISDVICKNEKQMQQVSLLCDNTQAIRCELTDTVRKHQELTGYCKKLEEENSELVAKNDELCDQLVCAKKNETSSRNSLIICKEKLLIAQDNVCNLNLETKCLAKKLNKKSEELAFTQRTLQLTVCQLDEETSKMQDINANHSLNETADDDSCRQKIGRPNPAVCQTDDSECQCLLEENNRLTCENKTLRETTEDLRREVQLLCDANNDFQRSIADMKIKISSKPSVDIGLQACLCSTVCQSKTVAKSNGESECKYYPNECCENGSACDSGDIGSRDSSLKAASQCSCPSDADCTCPGKTTKTCDCVSNILESEKLKCQLNEMEQLFKDKEKATNKMLCDTERRHNAVETEMKKSMVENNLKYQNKLKELEAQLETYQMTILRKEYYINDCLERENKLKSEIRKLNEITMESKEQNIKYERNKEYEQNKFVPKSNSMNEYKERSEWMNEELQESLKSKTENVDEQLKTYKDRYNDRRNEITVLGTESVTTENKAIRKQKKGNGLDYRKKSNAKVPVKNKFNLPCCIGSNNPCSRQKKFIEQGQPPQSSIGGQTLEGRLDAFQKQRLAANTQSKRSETSPTGKNKSCQNTPKRRSGLSTTDLAQKYFKLMLNREKNSANSSIRPTRLG